MRSTLALSLLPVTLVLAQDPAFLKTVTEALNTAGLSSLADVAGKVAGTPEGGALFSALQNGTYTIFAPTNKAFSAVPSSVASNVSLLTSILSYHVLPGNFAGNTSTSPLHTILRTSLGSPELVNLEGGQKQVLALTRPEGGNITILNQGDGTNVTVLQSAAVGNITLHVIPSVLLPPPSLTDFLHAPAASNISAIGDILSEVEVAKGVDFVDVIGGSAGFTFFAPSNEAISAAQSTLQQLQSNETALQTVLLNHVINGTSAYSTALNGNDIKLTSAAGQTFTAKTNSTGTFVTSGQTEVQVIQSDVLLSNGVVHVINGVFPNLERDDGAAKSAYESATSKAAEQAKATPTSPVGNPTNSSSAGGSGSNGGNNGAMSFKPVGMTFVGLLIGAVMVLA